MVKIKEIELPNRLNVSLNVSELREILQNINEVDLLHLKNDLIDIKIVKIETPVILYLIFGERYTLVDDDRGRWERVLNVTDDLEQLAWFINGL